MTKVESPGSPHAVVIATVVKFIDDDVTLPVLGGLCFDLDEGRADVDV